MYKSMHKPRATPTMLVLVALLTAAGFAGQKTLASFSGVKSGWERV